MRRTSRGDDRWREAYSAQGEQKKQQLELMHRYAESSEYRMAALVRHFGDLTDARQMQFLCAVGMRGTAFSRGYRHLDLHRRAHAGTAAPGGCESHRQAAWRTMPEWRV
jgi:hypothetical protein